MLLPEFGNAAPCSATWAVPSVDVDADETAGVIGLAPAAAGDGGRVMRSATHCSTSTRRNSRRLPTLKDGGMAWPAEIRLRALSSVMWSNLLTSVIVIVSMDVPASRHARRAGQGKLLANLDT